MMPSANKIEKPVAGDGGDPCKSIINLIGNKIRNLEKRKGKLEALKNEIQIGKDLSEDQKNAATKCDEVIDNIKYFKELTTNITQIFQDQQKKDKRTAKKEQLERQQNEFDRLKTLMWYQEILHAFDDDVKKDFRNGTNGATKLTTEQLNHLDELYKQVEISRDNSDLSFDQQVEQTAEKFTSLCEGRSREAFNGVTFKDLKDIFTIIQESNYFKKETKKPEVISAKPKESETSKANNERSVAKSNNEQPITANAAPFVYMQESTLDMDPAVVAISGAPYQAAAQYNASAPEVLAVQMAQLNTTGKVAGYVEEAGVGTHEPIPSQTFINQSYVGIGPTFTAMTMPQAIATVGYPVQHISQTSSPDMMTGQEQIQQPIYTETHYNNFENRGDQVDTSQQDKSANFHTDDYGQYNYARRGRGGRDNHSGSMTNGYRRGGRPGRGGGYPNTNGEKRNNNQFSGSRPFQNRSRGGQYPPRGSGQPYAK